MKGTLPENNKEIAVERLFAETNKMEIGDTITVAGTDMEITGYVSMPDYSALFEKNSDLMMDSYHFGIGIVTGEAFERYSAGLAVFMSQEQLNALQGYEESYFNGYFSDEVPTLKDETYLATVITPEDMAKLGNQMTSSFSQMVPLCLGIAVSIYLILMYLLTKIVIDKNARQISFLKVFGYEKKEIKRLYLTATTRVVIGSLLLGLPLVYFTIQKCFEAVLMKVSGYVPIYIPLYLFAEIVVIGVVSYSFINFFHTKKVDRIEMAEALKNRE